MLFSGNLYSLTNFIDEVGYSNEGDGFSDIPLSERLSLFSRLSIKRKSGKLLDFSAKYDNEDRNGGVKEWTTAYRGNDSVYGESIYTKRIELMGKYRFHLKKIFELMLLIIIIIRIVIMEILSMKLGKKFISQILFGIKRLI